MKDKDLFCIVGFGEILWDLLPIGKQVGGAPANFAYHAMVLGADSHIVSAIGDDDLGQELLNQLNVLGLKHEYISIDDRHPTSTAVVHLGGSGGPSYTIGEEVAWDYIPFSTALEELASRTQAVCFGTLVQRFPLSRSSLHHFLKSVSPECFRIFDVNLRQHYYTSDIILDSIRKSNVIKLNDEELSIVAAICSKHGAETEIMEQLLVQFDLDLGILTKGNQGSWLITRNEKSYLATPVVDVVDTVGAGDSFAAAVTIGLLQDRPLEHIHQKAVALAAYVCTQKGATPKIPNQLLSEHFSFKLESKRSKNSLT